MDQVACSQPSAQFTTTTETHLAWRRSWWRVQRARLTEQLLNELFITGRCPHSKSVTPYYAAQTLLTMLPKYDPKTGEQLWAAVQPAQPGEHSLHFTAASLCVFVVVFFTMVGGYSGYKALTSTAALECTSAALSDQGPGLVYGPASILRWLHPQASSWCFGGTPGVFDTDFLVLWGARWAPDMWGWGARRWLTSSTLHVNFMHLLSNCALFVALSSQLELQHGALRIAPAWVLAAVGGNLVRHACLDGRARMPPSMATYHAKSNTRIGALLDAGVRRRRGPLHRGRRSERRHFWIVGDPAGGSSGELEVHQEVSGMDDDSILACKCSEAKLVPRSAAASLRRAPHLPGR